MMRFILYFIALMLIASLASLFADIQGAFELRLGDYIISTQISVALGLVAGAIILAGAGALFAHWLWNIPARIIAYRQNRNATQAAHALTDAFAALSLGDHKRATQHAQNAQAALPHHALPLLITAQAAQNRGAAQTARIIYQNLLSDQNPHSSTVQAAQAGLFQIAMREGAYDDAHSIAEKTLRIDPKNHWAREGLFQLAAAQQNWTACLHQLKNIPRGDKQTTNIRLGIVHLAIAQNAHRSDQAAQARKHVDKALRFMPDFAPAIALIAILTARQNNIKKACDILARAWHKSPHPDLAQAFIICTRNQATKNRNAYLRNLTRKQAEHIESHILRAQLAISNQNWAQAQRILKSYINAHGTAPPPRRIAQLMAEIAHGRGDIAKMKQWQAQAQAAPPDVGWYGEDGTRLAHWSPLCPHSGKFNGVTWRTPSPHIMMSDANVLDSDVVIQKSRAIPDRSQSP